MFPGRIPSPTPSFPPAPSRTTVQPAGEPRTPSASTRETLNYTAPGFARVRPVFLETRSEGDLPEAQERGGGASFNSQNSLRPSTGRPNIKRGGASDTRYDRPRGPPQPSYGSPTRIQKQRAHRPSQRRRTPDTQRQETETDMFLKTPRQVHDDLRDKVRQDLTATDMKESGVVYVLRDISKPYIPKIGSSTNCKQRFGNLERKCGLNVEEVYRSVEITSYLRAEALVHTDLAHLIRPYRCEACKRTHKEWLEVSDDMAVKTVRQWVTFIQQQKPYNKQGQLKGIWHHLISKRTAHIPEDKIMDHNARRLFWSNVLAPPTLLDRYQYVLRIMERYPIEFYWQVLSAISWSVTCFVSRSHCAFYVLLFSVLSAWMSTLPTTHLAKSLLKPQVGKGRT